MIRYRNPELTDWQTIDRWSTLRDELNTLFEMPLWSGFGRQTQLFGAWTPAMDVYQNNDSVVAMIELPGMKKEDIEISLHDGVLTIAGERKSEVKEGENSARSERLVGRFRRSVTLPARVDVNKVSASYKDGILTVTLPKAEDAKPKQIQVNVD
jgi:HSP20 family protein